MASTEEKLREIAERSEKANNNIKGFVPKGAYIFRVEPKTVEVIDKVTGDRTKEKRVYVDYMLGDKEHVIWVKATGKHYEGRTF